MEIEVRIQGTGLADAMRRYAARRIRFALGRFAPRVRRVAVRISDISVMRGGVDQCCHINVELLPKGQLVLDQVDSDLFGAIDRASERIGEALRRDLQRTQDARTRRESLRTCA